MVPVQENIATDSQNKETIANTNTTTETQSNLFETESTTEKHTNSKETEKDIETDNSYTETNSTIADSEQLTMVWVPSSGTKYHSNSSCSNMKSPREISIEEAREQGYEPCKKCY
jgi:hypothetical protein